MFQNPKKSTKGGMSSQLVAKFLDNWRINYELGWYARPQIVTHIVNFSGYIEIY
jgi:hypothetical protein